MNNSNLHERKINTIILLFPIWLLVFYFKSKVAYYLVFEVLRLPDNSLLANSLQFFIATFLKISLLLVIAIFIMGVVRTYFSPEKTKKVLDGKPLLLGNSMAGILGIVTPFCSCSAIPLFLGFVKSGIPLGVTFSFLIAAPLINEVGVIMLIGIFGWKTGILYVLSGLVVAILSGWVIGKLKLEKWVQNWVYDNQSGTPEITEPVLKFGQRIICGYDAVVQILKGIWIYIVIGIAVGAFIHGYIPQNYLVSVMDESSWYSVPLAVAVGIPLYSCTAGAVPIALSLIDKGVPIGSALAFMMSVIGLSLPELIILKKVLKIRLIMLFVAILAILIMLLGYLFNWLL